MNKTKQKQNNKETSKYICRSTYMKIGFQNSIRRLCFLCHATDIKIALVNP